MGSGDFCLCSGMLRRENLNYTVNISNKALKFHGQSTIPCWKLPSSNISKHFAGTCFLTCFKNLLPPFSGVTEIKRPQWHSCEAPLCALHKGCLHVSVKKSWRGTTLTAWQSKMQIKLSRRITHTYLLQVYDTWNEDPVSTSIPPKSTCLQVPR